MNNAVVAWIRTHVPLAIGTGAAVVVPWLNDHQFGWIHIDSAQAGAVAAGLCVSGYYTLVHWGEQHWPGLGVLLGKAKQPFYRKLDTPPPPAPED